MSAHVPRGAAPGERQRGDGAADARAPVAVLGAAGLVGQHLVRLLDGHPSLRAAELVGSERSAGVPYAQAVDWVVADRVPGGAAGLPLLAPDAPLESGIVLSALPADVARVREPALARAGHLVCSNASAHRMSDGVPLVVPEVNPEALDAVDEQSWAESGGALVTNPNCVVTGVALALAPIVERWGIRSGAIVTLQALSGAGLTGPSALALTGNVVPWIAGEEEKVQAELSKILDVDLSLAVTVNRVPVLDGHMAHLFLELGRGARPPEVAEALRTFARPEVAAAAPSLPARPLVVRDESDRPQPRLDAVAGGGMIVSVGRIRSAPPFDLALTVVVSNAVRGAAGACLANAELCIARGVGRAGRAPRLAPEGVR